MSTITPKPIVLKDVTLLIGADNFEKQVSGVTLEPSVTVQDWQGMSPAAQFSDVSVATWKAKVDYAQDWETAGSLSRYLMQNAGVPVSAIFKPRNGGGSSFSATLVLVPGPIGGAGQAWAEGSVTLGVIGQPVEIPAGGALPVVNIADPATGLAAGNTAVKLYGSGFTGATSVKFGAVAASNFVVVSDTLIVATTAAAAVGSKPATVTTPAGVSVVLGAYSYV